MSTNTELDPLVNRYEHEAQRPRAEQALHTLKKIASMVKPIMRRRNWRVGILAEFYPAETNLLGLNTNRGQKINLRLRYPGDANQFLPLEEVVDTMLHELCHNEIGPHNAQFHALWDQLRDEHETLLRKGYTGEGFLGRGDRLGGQRLPLHEARRRARAAAEQRRVLTAGSGQRLGGTGIMRGQDARSIIANAVDRRIRIQKGCVSGTDAGRKVAQQEEIKKEKVEVTQAEQEDENEAVIMRAYIDLIEEEESAIHGAGYIPPSQRNPAGPRSLLPEGNGPSKSKAGSLLAQQASIEAELTRQRANGFVPPFQPPPVPAASKPANNKRPLPPSPSPPFPKPPQHRQQQQQQYRPPPPPPPPQLSPPDLPPDTWTCEVCTLVNPINYLTCDACTVERPSHYPQSHSSNDNGILNNDYGQYHPHPYLPSSTSTNTTSIPPKRETPNALKPKISAAEAHARFEREGLDKAAKAPVGWQCGGCGNWMEQQWWTCSICGRMKASS